MDSRRMHPSDMDIDTQMQHLWTWSMPIPVPRSSANPSPEPRFLQQSYRSVGPSMLPSRDAYCVSPAPMTFLPSTTEMLSAVTEFECNSCPPNSYAASPMTPPSLPTPDDLLHFHDDVSSSYSDSPSFFPCDLADPGIYDAFDTVSMKVAPSSAPVPFSSSNPLQSRQSQQQSSPSPGMVSEVDNLMKSLQQPRQPAAPILASPTQLKRHICPFADCSKSFSQPTHLKIHLRSHTGEKPYICSVPSCGQSFSQLGNLRTHERRHAGQPPNRKRYSSSDGSNGKKRYECILDDCRISRSGEAPAFPPRGKEFSQLGNLKAHMNKFHKETLARLGAHFANVPDDNTVTYEDRYLKAYFQELYRNSNKGIKGRGKGRKVQVVMAP